MEPRLVDAYRTISKMLRSPTNFGLDEHPPHRFIQELSAVKKSLISVLRDIDFEAEESLDKELSQDADYSGGRASTSVKQLVKR